MRRSQVEILKNLKKYFGLKLSQPGLFGNYDRNFKTVCNKFGRKSVAKMFPFSKDIKSVLGPILHSGIQLSSIPSLNRISASIII